MKTGLPEASPAKALLEELELFRGICHGTLDSIGAKLDQQIDAIKFRVGALGAGENVSSGKNRDIRDMLTLLRNAGVKPEKGRRKDLKKLDSISEDLTMMVEHW
ncbi:MAG: hypothetical protein WC076_07155 [Terrimicrobiaceae bacterium]|jgi:hypothetical protein